MDPREIELSGEVDLLLVLSEGAATRKRILEKLRLKPRNCNQVAEELEVDWWTIQKHLQVLVEGTLIKAVSFGRMKFYKITPNGELALKLASVKSEKSNS